MSTAPAFFDLLDCPPQPAAVASDGAVLVWAVNGEATQATITDQFKADAGEYHRRYAASETFERLFRRAVEAAGVSLPARPQILDLGSGSGVNSIVPWSRISPDARMVATDLSQELLLMLAGYARDAGLGEQVTCIQMDAMGDHFACAAFDLVTGAAILHHLENPQAGLRAAARALKPGGSAIFMEPFIGWSVMRLAWERVLAEAALRGEPLGPEIEDALRRMIRDIAERTRDDRTPDEIAALDDKWLFSRERMTDMARAAGFAQVRFVPNPDKPDLFRNRTAVQIRLATGRSDLELPAWAAGVLAGFDAALGLEFKREMMLDGTVVMTKAG